jgi:K(+)-stimulated pyrophosphate-energized sodium pump
MIPFKFASLTLNSVVNTAFSLIEEIKSQIRNMKIIEGLATPDYDRCVRVCTRVSLVEMIAPGLLAILCPFAIGMVFGPSGIAGMVLGSIISGA